MNIRSVKTVYDLMHYCHMPVWCQREIRDMKVGDTYFLGQYKHVADNDDGDPTEFVGEAWIEKERGNYHFYATWTLPLKPNRSLIMTSGTFKILKGGVIDFGENAQAVRSFALVSRYLNRIIMNMTPAECDNYYSSGTKPLFRGVCVDKDFISRKVRFIKDGESLKRVKVDYSNFIPTHQLQAIVTAGIALKQI